MAYIPPLTPNIDFSDGVAYTPPNGLAVNFSDSVYLDIGSITFTGLVPTTVNGSSVIVNLPIGTIGVYGLQPYFASAVESLNILSINFTGLVPTTIVSIGQWSGTGNGFKSWPNRSIGNGKGQGFKSFASGVASYGNIGEGIGQGFKSTAQGLGGATGKGNGFKSTAAGVIDAQECWYGKGNGFKSTASGFINVAVSMSGKGNGFRSIAFGLSGAIGKGNGFKSVVNGVTIVPETMLGKGNGFKSIAQGIVIVPAFAKGKGNGFKSTVWQAIGQGRGFRSLVQGSFFNDIVNSQAFVMNATTNAVSRFTNYPFSNIVRLGDSYYGIKSDGFYLLDGDLDILTPINGSITLKDSDFGVFQSKTVQYVYLNSDSETTVTPYVDGVVKTAQPSKFGGRKCTLGLGNKGRYWQFKIDKIRKLEGIEVLPNGFQRRVK